ncbi:MAG: DNRLRE domain-containing protein [Candidatus Eisenbacteria bacterium]
MKKIMIVLLAAALPALCPVHVLGETVEIEAQDAAVIGPGGDSDELRLLVRFSMPEVLSEGTVDFACMMFEADCEGEKGLFSSQAFALAKEWSSETVSWGEGWDKAGGDWDKSLSSYSIGEVGDGRTVEFDVTDFVNGWLAEPSKNFGLIVKVSGPYLGTFAVKRAKAPRLRILH